MRLLDNMSRTEDDDAMGGRSCGLGHRSQRRLVTNANGASSRDQPSAALWVTTKTDMLRDLTQLDTPAERVPEITEFWSARPEAGAASDRPIRGTSISTERRDRTSSSRRLAPRTERRLCRRQASERQRTERPVASGARPRSRGGINGFRPSPGESRRCCYGAMQGANGERVAVDLARLRRRRPRAWCHSSALRDGGESETP